MDRQCRRVAIRETYGVVHRSHRAQRKEPPHACRTDQTRLAFREMIEEYSPLQQSAHDFTRAGVDLLDDGARRNGSQS
jgi:hypothetical protein